ncbi:damage-control phosphatase ARMT1 family protein [Streptomyces sp. NPDC096339]|uniref:damage-control phosphatase ARMT1 family protein n=1 Tax=Streptomyces sp. NPDC096339 TaxID=3366086 RepID=UPI0038009F5F
MTPDASVILSDEPGSFAWGVLAVRHPALIKKVRGAFPYDPARHRALDTLLAQITQGVIEPLGDDAHDAARWAVWGRGHFGRSWFDVPFLWAESYFYRKLLEAVGYFEDGPWRGIDPFGPFKQAELSTVEADEEPAVLDHPELRPADAQAQAQALLLGSLWGNRADLGFHITSGTSTTETGGGGLVADESALLWTLLPEGSPATVCVVADNSGRELLADLLLVDHLLSHRHAEQVVLHVKPYPYYVSDATTADVIECLRRLTAMRSAETGAGQRLWSALSSGRLALRSHAFSCAPLPYADMPDDLRGEFSEVTLTLMKGDLNYRRLVGDRSWPATTPFADRTAYFPSPVAALRTLKSDVVVGLDDQTEATLVKAHEQRWRTSGTHALIQVRR